MDKFDFQTEACPGGSFHLFAPWGAQLCDTAESAEAVEKKGLSSWAGSEL